VFMKKMLITLLVITGVGFAVWKYQNRATPEELGGEAEERSGGEGPAPEPDLTIVPGVIPEDGADQDQPDHAVKAIASDSPGG
jgi:hypothetical protein